MTWSAPSERTKSTFWVLQTPVTSAPMDFAIWTANGPTLPDAPTISDLVARLDRRAATTPQALEREDRGVRERGRVLERHVRRDQLEGLLRPHRRTRRTRPRRAGRGRRTPDRRAGTGSPSRRPTRRRRQHRCPIRWFRGARRPRNSRTNPGFGPRPSRSARFTDAAWTRTSTSSSLGTGRSTSRDADDLGRAVALLEGCLHRSPSLDQQDRA